MTAPAKPDWGGSASVLLMFAQTYHDKAEAAHRLDFELGHLNGDLTSELTRLFGEVGRTFERYADAAREIAFAESLDATADGTTIPCLGDCPQEVA